ncbi:MAG: radical SAM protein [Nitrospinae bacterium]|nr:radical SAM protein [Nitrospinota bacterium]
MPIWYKQDHPDSIFKHFDNPSIAAFSVSTWNEQLCLHTAKRVKARFPECLIVFGGPHVPFDATAYFKMRPFVDVSVRGEGERAFVDVLTRFLESGDFQGIPGISYRHPETGECVWNAADQPKLSGDDLDIFPSPYLTGIFDPLMSKGLGWQAIIETNRGCPFPCSFCFWGQGGLNTRFKFFGLDRLREEIEWCGKHQIQYLFCADSNFGMFDRDKEIAQMLVQTKAKYGYPERFRVNYGKNTNDKIYEVAKLLHQHKLEKSITLSLQSLDEQALISSRRKNIKISAFMDLQKRYSKDDIPTYTELILGLPGETYQSWVDGLEECLRLGIKNNIFIYLGQILPNTEMSNPEYVQRHGMVTARIPLNEGHAAIRPPDIVAEFENVIIGTNTMPREDWIKSAVFSWVVQAFVGLKLGFYILIYLAERHQVKYIDFLRHMVHLEMRPGVGQIMREELSKFNRLAAEIAGGRPRTVVMKDFGDIYWEPEEALFFDISSEKRRFYEELLQIAEDYLQGNGISYDADELREVFEYQSAKVRQFWPLESRDLFFKRNIPEYFENYFSAEKTTITVSPQVLRVKESMNFDGDKKRFAREVVLHGRKGVGLLNDIEWNNVCSAGTLS